MKISVALLSWRVVAEIAMSNDSRLVAWLNERQRASSVVISQFSLIKASRHVQTRRNLGPVNPSGLLERFAQHHLLPQVVIGAGSVPGALFNSLAVRHGSDDLELFAMCLALQNDYEYVCWDTNELELVGSVAPDLRLSIFEYSPDGIQSSQS